MFILEDDKLSAECLSIIKDRQKGTLHPEQHIRHFPEVAPQKKPSLIVLTQRFKRKGLMPFL